MNKKVLSVALLVALGFVATSCQKENTLDFASGTTTSKASTVYTVQYVVNGILHSESFQDEEDVDALLMYLMSLVREGYDVIVFDNNYNLNTHSSKEVVNYTALTDADATKWARNKMQEGYSVHVFYDKSNNTFICKAYR